MNNQINYGDYRINNCWWNGILIDEALRELRGRRRNILFMKRKIRNETIDITWTKAHLFKLYNIQSGSYSPASFHAQAADLYSGFVATQSQFLRLLRFSVQFYEEE